MKIYKIPNPCRAILFDMDSTLYTNAEYARVQVDVLVERLAQLKRKSFVEMEAEIAVYRKKWAVENGGLEISLGNTFVAFGVGMDESVRWRNELIHPERHISRDGRLRVTLEKLAMYFTMAVVTNNPVSVAEKTLDALGVRDLFRAIVGLDTCGVSKPHAEPFMKAVTLCCGPTSASETCVSVGDRYDIDIALPLELGMGGILVSGVEDVHALPELLSQGWNQ